MFLRNESVDATPPVQSGSPTVIWQAIAWMLLSLAVNSMSQQSGRYRIYMASSPLFCLADAVGTIIRFVTKLRTGATQPDTTDTVINTPAAGRAWPRWVFFVLGPLPAAIKLCSFVGTPWTKTWGIIFLSSFSITELLAKRSPPRINTICTSEMTASGLPADVGLFRHALQRTSLDSFLFILALLAHCALVVWAGNQARLAIPPLACVSLDACRLIQWFKFITITCVCSLWVALLVSWLIFRLSGRKSSVGRIAGPLEKVYFSQQFLVPVLQCGKQREAGWFPPFPQWIDDVEMFCLPWIYLAVAIYVGYRGLDRVGRRWPRVAEVLLVKRKSTQENQDSDGGNNAGPVDDRAWLALCFFFTNLMVSVLWYALVYDPTGTLNPSWTEVFG
ncbi:hypothetical protein B0H19DRAFT_65568 [Mycena capillaripes]|nr:hypothetical protein B0H19DRAFT_65568 [Mycena capillaripes]